MTKVKAFVGTLLIAFCLTVRAQESAGVITNVTVIGGNIQFEVVTPAPPGDWTVEAADTLNGPWGPVVGPQPPTSPVLVPVDRPARFFRIQWNGWYSSNIAGYYKLTVPTGFSMIANQFSQRNNTLAEVLPSVPDTCLLYKYDAVNQAWKAVCQFRFGSWDQPNETLAPGEGAIFQNPSPNPLQLTFVGTLPTLATQVRGGWNILSLPIQQAPTIPPPTDGDQIYRFNNASGGYIVYTASVGQWSPSTPAIDSGEGFWYSKNSPPQNPPPQVGCAYFNTYPWNGPIIYPTAGPGGPPLEGTNWLAQLCAGPSAGSVTPIGDPLPFLTGAGAGYIDVRDGGVRYIPTAQPGAVTFVQLRYWDVLTGTTWQQAGNRGTSSVIQITTGGYGSPPTLPPSLIGIIPRPPGVSLEPTNQAIPVGGRASIQAYVSGGPLTVFYQWQKMSGANWIDIANATSDQFVIDPVSADSEGSYRVKVTNMQGLVSQPAMLAVLAPWHSSDPQKNSSTFQFTLSGDSAYDYAVEVSTNLLDWAAFTQVSQPSAHVSISDTNAVNFGQRFFRIKGTKP